MDEYLTMELNEWSFPNVELNKFDVEHLLKAHQDKMTEVNKAHEIEMTKINDMKQELAKKIALVDNMLKELTTPCAKLDSEIIHVINNLIKSAVKKIIYKEIKLDSKVLPNMINELATHLQKTDHIKVIMSEEDTKRIDSSLLSIPAVISTDNSLREGDVIVKADYSEIHCIIEEQIEKCLGA